MSAIDILICAYNEAPFLGRALESLGRQTSNASNFNIIVVDNASTDETAQVVARHDQSLKLTYVVEPRLGLNIARNTGYTLARAPYVAHLDADAEAHPQWIESILGVIQALNPDLCGGPYYPYFLGRKPAWFLDRYNSNDLGAEPRFLSAEEYLSGTNMIWRRGLVESLGGFKSAMGLAGRGLARGDETDLMARARRADPSFRAYYDPSIVVYHLTRPQTFSMAYWLRRHFAAGRGYSAIFDQARPAPGGRLRYLARGLRAALSAPLQLLYGWVGRDRRRYPFFENYLYEQFLPRAAIVGQAYAALWPSDKP